MSLVTRTFEIGSPSYALAWRLRREVLLDPFGIDHELAVRDDDVAIHLGLFEGSDPPAVDACRACLMLVARSDCAFQMRQVAVDPSHQGRGLGRRLLTDAEQLAFDRGKTTIFAHARHGALLFYQAQGYTRSGGAFLEVGIKHYFVEKNISPPGADRREIQGASALRRENLVKE